ncbi:hypothetical protein LEMA_P004570.1 [Plenodomus lingam JN3]|uniref:Heterokaryon incompatibility domain-containing protein n=1 Tax=Leptosphaeria maculans (strain JN3 / isolate v23.1.3 / race Av1-4-5-6-7-8) TaxID=985895 RepID=E5AEN1_LEPMJ|nr:hypothetical protein LEMA_P004570.1 [Plenodomus lingam JN3]CBY01670.1 hypothetical protein LEMA_P004570.1 [Plenodomus lingam JN3]
MKDWIEDLRKRLEKEDNRADTKDLPIHTCSYCDRLFDMTWEASPGPNPTEKPRLRIQLSEEEESTETPSWECGFYQHAPHVYRYARRHGLETVLPCYKEYPNSILRVSTYNDTRCTFSTIACYAAGQDAFAIGPDDCLKTLPNLNPASTRAVNFMHSVLKDRLRSKLQPSGKMPPKRLLRLDPSGNTMQLIETTRDEEYSYGTLSYCWGGFQAIMTTRETIASHKHGVLIDTLPRTIQDAVWVTTVLNLQYLWVDVLCIIQDDEEDVAREIANQANIYRASAFTILAGDCAHADAGFLHPRPKPSIEYHISVRMPEMNDAVSKISVQFEKKHRKDPVEERVLLSPYVLYFSKSQLVIHCHDRVYVDGGYDNHALKTTHLRRNWDAHTSTIADSDSDWQRLVQPYSGMHLTKSSDKLPAISALAEAFGRCFLDQDEIAKSYKAGIWLQHMPNCLLWKRLGLRIHNLPHYRAPSWSWASTDDLVEYDEELQGATHSDVEILSCTTTPTFSSAPFGEVTSGELRLRGPVKPLSRYRMDMYSPPFTLHDLETSDTFAIDFVVEPEFVEPRFAAGSAGSRANVQLSMLLCVRKQIPTSTLLLGLVLARRRGESGFRRVSTWSRWYDEREDGGRWLAAFERVEVGIV